MTGLVIGESGQVSQCLQRLRPDATYLDRRNLDLAEIGSVYETILARCPDFIVNTAAYTAVDQAESEEGVATSVNGTAVGEMARAASELDIPLVHISTDYVYSGAATSAYLEDDPTGPINAYGRSKLAGEQLIATRELNHVWVLRTSWVFSEFGTNFVKTMIRLANQGIDPLRVVGDQTGCPTYAGDIAEVIRRILERWKARQPIPSGVYHCTSDGVTTWADFARQIVQRAVALGVTDKAPEVVAIGTEEYPTPAVRPMNSVLDGSKLVGALGWQAPEWRVGLERSLSELRAMQ